METFKCGLALRKTLKSPAIFAADFKKLSPICFYVFSDRFLPFGFWYLTAFNCRFYKTVGYTDVSFVRGKRGMNKIMNKKIMREKNLACMYGEERQRA